MPMIWTDEDGRVERIHYNHEDLPAEKQDGVVVDSVEEPNNTGPPHKRRDLYYDSESGFSVVVSDKFEEKGMDNLSEPVKTEISKLVYVRNEYDNIESAIEEEQW